MVPSPKYSQLAADESNSQLPERWDTAAVGSFCRWDGQKGTEGPEGRRSRSVQKETSEKPPSRARAVQQRGRGRLLVGGRTFAAGKLSSSKVLGQGHATA